MLIIGHRGASGLAPENTLEALRAGMHAGAHMLEFDVRLTADAIPILAHDTTVYGKTISHTSLADLQKAGNITLLRDVLDEFFGEIPLNLEFKPRADTAPVYALLKQRLKTRRDYESIMISSFRVRSLYQLRQHDTQLKLALLHSINPFAFITYQRSIRFAAVGWHRLHVNALATTLAKKVGLFTYVYTVNRPKAAQLLEQKGIDGIVTDYPDRMAQEI